MTPEAFDAAALALPGATMTVQWGADHVYKVGGKMFAVLGGGGFSLKASEVAFEVLSEAAAPCRLRTWRGPSGCTSPTSRPRTRTRWPTG